MRKFEPLLNAHVDVRREARDLIVTRYASTEGSDEYAFVAQQSYNSAAHLLICCCST